MTRRWKLGAVVFSALGLALVTSAGPHPNPGVPSAMHTQGTTREAQSAPAAALQASRRMTAREMSQTIGGDWFTELVQVVGAAVSGYDLSTSVGWFCALVSCT